MATILIVDDDPHLREVVRYTLARTGHTVAEAEDGRAALLAFAHHKPDFVVLDIVMPVMDGLACCRELRRSSNVPILFLSSRDEEVDRILGLELGGDDYLCKPFSPRELAARVSAILRRTEVRDRSPEAAPASLGSAPPSSRKDDPVRTAGPIRMDCDLHRCWVEGQEISLTLTEWNMLLAFVEAPGRVLTRDRLADLAYSDARHVSDRTFDSHIRRIRAKCKDAGIDPIETVHGLGYRLRTDRATG